jgi:hypothetical protein
MPNNIFIGGIDYASTIYLPSRDIISLFDLITFLKSDSCLKIGYMTLNLNCGLYFYSGIKGSGHDNREFVQLFKISDHRNNMDCYIEHVNMFFFIKEEIGDIIKKDPWITFNREGITPETKNFPPQCTTSSSIKQTAFLLSKYNYRKGNRDIKYEFNLWCSGYTFEFLERLNNECDNIGDINKDNLHVSYLAEYIPSMSGHIDYFEEAKRYAKNNIPSSDIDEIKLIHSIKEKFMLSDRKIATIVFERDLNNVDIDTLTKRVQRKLKKFKTPPSR